MSSSKAYIRLIIHADNKTIAQNIVDELISKDSIVKNSLTELKRYEDNFHYEFSFSVEISAETVLELEHKSFKLCTTIVNGPWLFLNLPKDENEFEFEAIFNHEAFIQNSKEYTNKLKWAHLEIAQ
jgi:hypothetical protein